MATLQLQTKPSITAVVTNVHEIDGAGQPVTGWCFVPSGGLVAGDVVEDAPCHDKARSNICLDRIFLRSLFTKPECNGAQGGRISLDTRASSASDASGPSVNCINLASQSRSIADWSKQETISARARLSCAPPAPRNCSIREASRSATSSAAPPSGEAVHALRCEPPRAAASCVCHR